MTPFDVRPVSAALYFLPLAPRVPLKFGVETTTAVTYARVRLTVEDAQGRRADGWGETPLSVQWVWPSPLPYADRNAALQQFCIDLTRAWVRFDCAGHPMEIGHAFQQTELPKLARELNTQRGEGEPVPWLAALVCCSAFDLALHDAYGVLHGLPVYETYNARYMNTDLAAYLMPAKDRSVSFRNRYPEEFLTRPAPRSLVAWHLIGGKDPLERSDLDGSEPDDGYPVLLRDWIHRDGLRCLKVKLRGDDEAWDLERLIRVGQIAIEEGCPWLSADFNCTVTDPAYVTTILDQLMLDCPRIYGMLLYVEQPFPYDLHKYQIDVRAVAARKPLYMDESAHDWTLIELGRQLGWSGVALKTCKTQTEALLSLCWAKAHEMPLMVQDLSNAMLAQIPHLLLAGHAGTIMGVETNGSQYYPQASEPEATVHPGIYVRQNGKVNLTTLNGPGLGYGAATAVRMLPDPAVAV